MTDNLTQISSDAWSTYKTLLARGERRDAAAYFHEQIWRPQLATWKSTPNVPDDLPSFDVSVHTLGTSPEATMLAILGTRAPVVHLLHSPETAQHIARIEAELDLSVTAHTIPKSDPAALYRAAKTALPEHPARLAFDLTSGTKAMTASLAACAFYLQGRGTDAHAVYIDSSDWDAEARRPVPGSERLIVLPSPETILTLPKE